MSLRDLNGENKTLEVGQISNSIFLAITLSKIGLDPNLILNLLAFSSFRNR